MLGKDTTVLHYFLFHYAIVVFTTEDVMTVQAMCLVKWSVGLYLSITPMLWSDSSLHGLMVCVTKLGLHRGLCCGLVISCLFGSLCVWVFFGCFSSRWFGVYLG